MLKLGYAMEKYMYGHALHQSFSGALVLYWQGARKPETELNTLTTLALCDAEPSFGNVEEASGASVSEEAWSWGLTMVRLWAMCLCMGRLDQALKARDQKRTRRYFKPSPNRLQGPHVSPRAKPKPERLKSQSRSRPLRPSSQRRAKRNKWRRPIEKLKINTRKEKNESKRASKANVTSKKGKGKSKGTSTTEKKNKKTKELKMTKQDVYSRAHWP